MNDLEKKLQAYRNREKRKYRIDRLKKVLEKPASFLFSNKSQENAIICEQESVNVNRAEDAIPEPQSDVTTSDNQESSSTESFRWKKFVTYLVIWCCLFRYAVYVQFGAVFIILTGFYLIWTNTRTGPRKTDEMSAYSVFNPNCERIEGTLDAEQFEKELRYGMIM